MPDGSRGAEEIAGALGELYVRARLPILVVKKTGEILGANDAALATYGYSIEQIVTMRVHDLIAESRDVEHDLEQALHGAPLLRRPHRKKDGTLFSVLPSAFRMNILGDEVIVSVLQDVTPLDTAETRAKVAVEEANSLRTKSSAIYAELLAADRLATVGRLVAGVAHEINNPAALVTLNLGVLRDRLQRGRTDVEEALTMIDESLVGMARIRDIVRDLKGFTRERPRETVDLSLLAAGVVRMTQHEVRGRVRVDQRLDSAVFAKVRSSRVSQVVTNLLVNAAQASPDHTQGEVVLRTFLDRDEACIEVSDSGPGVPEHLVERIFEPFFTTREDSGGTGLGLWLARGIVEEEGGTIRLSPRPGGGAVFRVSLPAAPPR